jgi:SAM-dependent methyltransferase
MADTFNNAAPWGRSYDEYVRMFNLSAANLTSRVLDCAGGPASFNAEARRRGGRIVSCDPIYALSGAAIARLIEETRDAVLAKTYDAREHFVWREIRSIEELGRMRMDAMERFLADLPAGTPEGRYLAAGLPALPFRDGGFDLALCSHFLFTYSDLFSLEFHIASFRELCRVAREARVFPLLAGFDSGRAPHVAGVIDVLTAEGYRCEVRRVPYEFQKGGNEMLCVSRHPKPGG